MQNVPFDYVTFTRSNKITKPFASHKKKKTFKKRPTLFHLIPELHENALIHYNNSPMQYTAILKTTIFQLNNCYTFLIFAQNIDCGYTLSTHDLCFRTKIRKRYSPVNPSFTI